MGGIRRFTPQGHEVPAGHIHGIAQTARYIHSSDPRTSVIFCVDHVGREDERSKADPGYKGNREGSEYPIHSEIPAAIQIISGLPGIYFAHKEGLEADDLMYSLAEEYHTLCEVIIYSGDNDLLQAQIFPGVRIARSMTKGQFICLGQEYWDSKFPGLTPESIVLYRAIKGDTSDNLPGYPRFPRALAVAIATNFKNPHDFLRRKHEGLPGFNWTESKRKHWNDLVAKPRRLQTNYQIMKLRTREQIYPMRYERFNKTLASEFGLSSFLGYADRVLNSLPIDSSQSPL